jgi:hypothetical protein
VDELIAEEIAFRTLLRRPADYAAWARETRLAWEQTPAGAAAVYESPRPRDWQDTDGEDTE